MIKQKRKERRQKVRRTTKTLSEFGQRLEKLLRENDISKTEFSQKIGINRTTLYDWLYGVSFPKPQQVEKICRVLGFLKPGDESFESKMLAQLQLYGLETVIPESIQMQVYTKSNLNGVSELIMREVARALAKTYLECSPENSEKEKSS